MPKLTQSLYLCFLVFALACEKPSLASENNTEEDQADLSIDMNLNNLPLNNGGEESRDDMVDMNVLDIQMSEENSLYPLPPEGYPLFRMPIAEEDIDKLDHRIVFGVDHDQSSGVRIICEDYAGRIFPHCYDGHQGSDFMLLGGFETMDQGSAKVVSALGGSVIDIEDGHYDRCHADAATIDVSCDGYPMNANYVTIEHANGWTTHYYHLKKNSILVSVGEQVSCGQELGLIGSSGYSSAPHLHFQVEDSFGGVWDPFAGPVSQNFSLWVSQPPSEEESLPSTSCSSP